VLDLDLATLNELRYILVFAETSRIPKAQWTLITDIALEASQGSSILWDGVKARALLTAPQRRVHVQRPSPQGEPESPS
jgi:hypothetical protein